MAFYYLPAFALRSATPQIAAIYHDLGLDTIPFVKGFQLLSPTVLGGVQIYWNDPFFVNGAAHIPYVGIVALLTAALARPGAGRHRTLFLTSASASAIILLKLFGVPPVQWLGRVPVFNEIHFSHYLGVPLGLPLAFLAALGLERIVRGTLSLPAALTAAVAGVIAIAGVWRAAGQAGIFEGPTASYWSQDWRFLAVVTVSAIAVMGAAASREISPAGPSRARSSAWRQLRACTTTAT